MDDNNFNYYEYIYNYKDLRFFDKAMAYKHYLIHGINEGRIYNTKNLHDFDPIIYKNLYFDLQNMTDEEAKLHYIRFGKYEGRSYKLKNNKYKIAVICLNYGNYDQVETDITNITNYHIFDWYYLTDNTNNKQNGWTYINDLKYHNIYMNKIHNNDTNRMISKFYKTQLLNITFMNKYDYIIWMDASIIIENNNFINDILKLIDNNKESEFFIFEHSERNNIKDECTASLTLDKYKDQDLENQINNYYNDNYKDELYESGFFIYKNNLNIKKMMNNWWEEIKKYSYQCQLSLPYVLQKNNINVFKLNEPDFEKGVVMGNGSVWRNKLVGYVRNHNLFIKNEQDFVKGIIMGNDSVWRNRLVEHVRNNN
jgi:hypothetical protein